MSKFRVAHIIYSPQIGGSEMVAANVCRHLDRRIFDPIILFMRNLKGEMPEVLSSFGIPFYGLNFNRFSMLFRSIIVAVVLNKLKIDILHVHHVSFYRQIADGIAFSRVRRVLLTEHSKHAIVNSVVLQNSIRNAARYSKFTVVSDELKEYFVEKLKIPVHSVKVIKNGVDVNKFMPRGAQNNLRHAFPSVADGKILMHVGRFIDAKDHETLLKAMRLLVAKCVNIYLFLIGEGELRCDIVRRIGELGLRDNVFLLGCRTDVCGLIPCADVFVLSSKHEGFPLVLLEAMSCGVPIVASNVGGIPEIVKDGVNGFLVPPESPCCLAERIECLINSKNAKEIGLAGREMVLRDFSMQQIAGQYARLYLDTECQR